METIKPPKSPERMTKTDLKEPNPNNPTVATKHEDSVVFTERFTGIRKQCRDYFHPMVRSAYSTNYIVQQQKYRTNTKTFLWNTVSIVGSHDFFVAFFPFLIFGFGWYHIAGQLLQRAAMGVYIGNWFKDYLCLPRPPVPPVVQLDHHASHGFEFGLPSTHAISAICLPFYILGCFLSPADGLNFWLALSCACLYASIVIYSRLYLGMHSITDVVIGMIIGTVILVGGEFVTYLHNSQFVFLPDTPLSIFLFGIFLLMIHPEPYGPCPCFVDSACFIGSAFGYLVANIQLTTVYRVENITFSLFLLRWFIGAGLLFGGRLVFKPLLKTIGYSLFKSLKLPTKTYVYSLAGKKPLASPKWDIEILLKYVCYFLMVYICIERGPHIVDFFELW